MCSWHGLETRIDYSITLYTYQELGGLYFSVLPRFFSGRRQGGGGGEGGGGGGGREGERGGEEKEKEEEQKERRERRRRRRRRKWEEKKEMTCDGGLSDHSNNNWVRQCTHTQTPMLWTKCIPFTYGQFIYTPLNFNNICSKLSGNMNTTLNMNV